MSSAVTSARRLVRAIAQRFMEDRCVQVAGDLTFTTLLALVPLFTIALTLVAAFPVFEEWSNAFKAFLLTTLVPEVGGKVITVYMQQFADNAGRLTALGLVFLAVTAVLLMVSIERVFNAIWRARRPRTLVQRLVIYWTTITAGPLLIGASLSLTSWLVTQSIVSVGGAPQTQTFMLKVLPVVLNGIAFSLLYVAIPNRRVRARDAVVGGAVAAVGFEVIKRGFGLYVQLVPTYALVYGTFATIPVFLLWVYVSWLIVLFGAVVVAVLPGWRLGASGGDAPSDAPLHDALRLIELMDAARLSPRTPDTFELARQCAIAEERAESLLYRMQREGWVRRAETGGWMLMRDLTDLRLAEVFGVFALDLRAQPRRDSPLLRGVESVLGNLAGNLDLPLKQFLPEPTPANLPEPLQIARPGHDDQPV